MDDMFKTRGRLHRKAPEETNLHHYRDELFYKVIDMQLQELNSRFIDSNIELLLCVACLCPDDAFIAFDKKKLIRLAQFYPKEFSARRLMKLDAQLKNYILYVRSSSSFEGLEGIAALAKRMVETRLDKVYTKVYLLLTLALILPVASATVDRAFSTMNFVKIQLPNRLGDQWKNDNLVVDIEKDIFRDISNEVIMQRLEI
ncbi:uncharacterized protein LOC132299284 isoform X2 [Cornus florida]|uniref:uncharacterized protein LOC132299284 isoform X2 n=1 Tax=Cornus florida TaxID=4283 RepID=UPI00289C84BD|nr:uncharacterized protein LOC132299284 isoform X2 [Cornus florida]